jgi:cell wall-associated NlpC family hydrolase
MRIYILLLSFLFALNALAEDSVTSNPMQSITKDTVKNAEDTSDIDSNPTWTEKTQEVLMHALSLTGIDYRYGGSTPETGFDCSGFVRYVFGQAAKITLPHSSRAISQIGQTIQKDNLKPGDLVFFNTLKTAFSHVGIYVGNNKFIHSPRTGAQVRVDDMSNSYWAKRFSGAQRLDTELKVSE